MSAGGDLLADSQPRAYREVAVEEEVFSARVLLVDRDAARAFAPQPNDLAVRRREDRRAAGRADVDRQVRAVAAPAVQEGIAQRHGVDAFDRDPQVGVEQVAEVDVLRAHAGLRRLGAQEGPDPLGNGQEALRARLPGLRHLGTGHFLGGLRLRRVGLVVQVSLEHHVHGLAGAGGSPERLEWAGGP
jgi:hypothetical protein